MEVALWVTVGLSALVYGLVGLLLSVRRHQRAISSRSPWLLLIAHWSIFADLLLLYQAIWQYKVTDPNYKVYYTVTTLICHYLYYFPYLLRCYRLKFVFTLDENWDNTYFRANIRRSTQNWLLCILLVLMLPVLIVAVLIFVYPDEVEVVPVGTAVGLMTTAIYELVCFLEEVLFVLAVFQLRKVQDSFSMTRELTIVCIIWMCNSAFSRFSQNSWWLYECAGRNWALMLVSSLWPVCKSFHSQGFSEPITTEVANSLDLVLQNQFTLNCFEKFLTHSSPHQSKLLEFWLLCEIYHSKPTSQKAEEIGTKYVFSREISLPEPIGREISAGKELGDRDGLLFVKAQEVVFEQLRELFWQFQRSSEYSKMMREVMRQEIYLNRVVVTSLHGQLIY